MTRASSFAPAPSGRARDLLLAAGLPRPAVNAWFATRAGHGHELDLWYPALGINLEIDGPQHELPHQRRKDRLRDADLGAFGIRVVRVPDTVVTERPSEFVAIARDVLERP